MSVGVRRESDVFRSLPAAPASGGLSQTPSPKRSVCLKGLKEAAGEPWHLALLWWSSAVIKNTCIPTQAAVGNVP